MAVKKIVSREIRLKSHPVGLPTRENFEVVSVSLPEPSAGEVLVKNIYMSVDPYMRGRMIDRKSYTPPFQIGEAMSGGAVGRVVASLNDAFQEGSYVMSMMGWREHFISDGRDLTPIDPKLAPIQAYLGTFGMPGFTAYYGLLEIGRPQAGETVFVSAAAGAVGSVVCQIAKIKGCRVVGSAGSERKVAWLKESIGVDAAFNYKTAGQLPVELGKHAPNGIDVYFDNVGGDHLEAAIEQMNAFGRVVCCGMISLYNATAPVAAPRNLTSIVGKRLSLKGFIISDHWDQLARFQADMAGWLSSGDIHWEETIVEGIEQAPQALIGLFTGENLGKMLVKLTPDSSS